MNDSNLNLYQRIDSLSSDLDKKTRQLLYNVDQDQQSRQAYEQKLRSGSAGVKRETASGNASVTRQNNNNKMNGFNNCMPFGHIPKVPQQLLVGKNKGIYYINENGTKIYWKRKLLASYLKGTYQPMCTGPWCGDRLRDLIISKRKTYPEYYDDLRF